MNQVANGRLTHPRLGVLNLVVVCMLVVVKVLKLMYVALRGAMRSLQGPKDTQKPQPRTEEALRREAAPSKLKEAVDEPPARVVRRSTSDKPAAHVAVEESKPSIWDKKPAMRIADRHADVMISKKQYRFSVYLAENEIQRIEMGQVRKPLAAFTRSMAANERVAFTLEEAVEYTRREIAAARRRGPSRKTEGQAATQPAEPVRTVSQQHPEAFLVPDLGPSSDECAPPWANMPCFEELDAQATGSSPEMAAPRVPEPVSAAAPRPQQPIQRNPPPPAQVRPSGENGVEDGPVDFRGARRVVGEVISLGLVDVTKPKQDPFEIYAITLVTKDGEEHQFRGYELEQHVEKNRVVIGDVVGLKRGRQKFWQIRSGVRKEKSRNVYDFKVESRGRR